MIAFCRSYGGKHILFSFILSHDKQVSAIKLLVAEVDDARMAAIVLPKHSLRHILYHAHHRLQKTVFGAVVTTGDIILCHNSVEFRLVFGCHNIWQLQGVANNYGILGTGQSQNTCIYRHL